VRVTGNDEGSLKIFRRCRSPPRSAWIQHATEQRQCAEHGWRRAIHDYGTSGVGVAWQRAAARGSPRPATARRRTAQPRKRPTPRGASESEKTTGPKRTGRRSTARGRLRVRARPSQGGRPPYQLFFSGRHGAVGAGPVEVPRRLEEPSASAVSHHNPGRGREGDGFGMSAAAGPPPRPRGMPTPAWLARRTGCGTASSREDVRFPPPPRAFLVICCNQY
jgi:hypothetical protein